MKNFIFIIVVIFNVAFAHGQSSQRIQMLYDEGKKLYDQWDLRGAAERWEQALNIAKSISNKERIGFLSSYLGIIYSNFCNYPRALTYYEQALKIDKEIGDRKGEGVDLGNIGGVYWNLGDYPRALDYHQQALKINREIANKQSEGNNLNNIGLVYLNLGDYPKALEYHQQALKIAREIGDKQGEGNNLTNIGLVYWNLGYYSRALEYHQQALKISREIGDKQVEGNNLTNIGLIYWDLGDYTRVLDYYQQALKITKEIGDRRGEGDNLGNIGLVYSVLGAYPRALNHYQQALKIAREIDNKQGEGNNFTNSGIFYQILGDYPRALEYHQQALKIAREIGDRQGEGNNLSNIGNVSQNLGDYSRALDYYQQALEIKKEIGVPTAREEANIADIWLDQDQIEKAEETFSRLGWVNRLGRLNLIKRDYPKAIEYYHQSLEKHLKNLDAIFMFADYVGLGKGYEGQQDYENAQTHYAKGIDLVEEQREGLAEAERANFFGADVMNFKRIDSYEGMVRVLDRRGNPNGAFFYAENLKARLLSEAIARGYLTEVHVLPAKLEKEEDDYSTRIRGLRKQMEALYKNNVMDTYYEKEAELKQVKDEQQAFIGRLREACPEYAAIHYPQPIKPQEALLNPKEVLIEFEVTNNATLVFMLAKNQLKNRRINLARDSLEQLVLDYRGYFENISQTSQLGKYDPKKGNQLYALLFGDLLKTITEGTTLIIVADEFLGILPFEALVTDLPVEEKIGESEFGPFPLGVNYLGDKYAISYAQSATSLTLLRTLKKGGGTGQQMLVVADPIFSANDSRLSTLAQAKLSDNKVNLMGALKDWKETKRMGVEGVRLRDEGRAVAVDAAAVFPRLEKTMALAQTVQTLFGKNALVFSGSEASEEKIRAMDISQYRYLTFATHGILDNTVPYIREPALVLSQVSNPDSVDGFLTMSEVMGLKLNAEVVALTACETGLGKNVSGEGVMGMGRAFQYAGAQNVLVSLWSVAETSATELTAAFFKYVKQGTEPKEAIRLARNEIRQKGYEHPFYWASFILFGK